MKKLFGAIAALVVLGGAAYGGWVYAGKPAIFGGSTAPSENGAVSAKFSEEMKSNLVKFNEPYSLPGGEPASLQALGALLPEQVQLVHTEESFDEATGATTFTDVRVQLAEFPEFGLEIDQLRVWALDAEAFAARIRGERTDETNKIASRIDARGVHLTGLELMMSEPFQAYMNTLGGIEEDITGEDAVVYSAEEMELLDYAFGMDRMVIDNLTLAPWEFDPKNALEDEEAQILQQAAAYIRMVETGPMLFEGLGFKFLMSADGVKMDLDMAGAVTTYSNFTGGDMDLSLGENMTFSMSMSLADPENATYQQEIMVEEMFGGLPLSGSIRSSRMDGLKVRNALGYLVRGEMPPYTETNFMSIGQVLTEDIVYEIDGIPLFSMGRYDIQALDFHWFIPTKLKYRVDDIAYELDGFAKFISTMEPDMSPDERDEMLQTFDFLKEEGIERISFDMGVEYDWQPTLGEVNVFSEIGFDGFSRGMINIEGLVPTYGEATAIWSDEMLSDEEKSAAFEELMQTSTFYKTGKAELIDEGGIDFMYTTLLDLAKKYPDQFGPMLANATPESMKQMAVSGIGLAGIEMGKNHQPAEEWFQALADWVSDGGKVIMRVEPDQPIGMSLVEETIGMRPTEIIDLLGVTVTYEAPQ